MTPTAQRRAEEAKLLAAVVEDAIDQVNWMHTAENVPWKPDKYYDGFRVPIKIFTSERWQKETVYVYALPWARGWSIFADDYNNCGVYDWRNVKSTYKGLQRPLYCERGDFGAWKISSTEIAQSVVRIVATIERFSKARETAHRKKHWPVYLARTLARVTEPDRINPRNAKQLPIVELVNQHYTKLAELGLSPDVPRTVIV